VYIRKNRNETPSYKRAVHELTERTAECEVGGSDSGAAEDFDAVFGRLVTGVSKHNLTMETTAIRCIDSDNNAACLIFPS
jgi:hypothetical protein